MDQPSYQPYYCEENIWHLCHDRAAGADDLVLFISNEQRSVAMWHSRQAGPEEAVFWDYHVVLLTKGPAWQVWDLDTRLPVPAEAGDYLTASFQTRDPRFQPCFRLIPVEEYLNLFSSDRSHMKQEDGRYREPPPPWPPIFNGRHNTLERYIDMGDDYSGPVRDLAQLCGQLDIPAPDQSSRSSKKSSTL